MSIPFSPTRPDSTLESTRTQALPEGQNELESSAGGGGAPGAGDMLAAEDGIGPDGEPLPREGSSIEQIRDILFGREMGAYEERFSLLERRFQVATEALRQEIKERLDSLDAHLREVADALGRRITHERDIRSESVEELVTSIRQHRDSLGKRIEEVETAANEGVGALRPRF